MRSNVVALKRINPTRDEVSDPIQKLLANIRGLAWKQYAGRLEDLAVEANLNIKTVEAFVWGVTEKPHFTTIMKLLIVFGFAERILQVVASDYSLSAQAAQALKLK